MSNFWLVDNLMDKYGEGSTQIPKCQTCEYEKKIYSCSGGTHITEGGSLMVYAEEDDLSVQIVTQVLLMEMTVLLVRE